MLGLNKFISTIKNRKNFKKVSIDLLRENQRISDSMDSKIKDLEADNKKLREQCSSMIDLAASEIDKNRKLKEQIEELEGGNERWNMLDL
jgi:cell shape-determining protein MreC